MTMLKKMRQEGNKSIWLVSRKDELTDGVDRTLK